MRAFAHHIRRFREDPRLIMTGLAAVAGFGLALSFSATAAPAINGGPDVSGITETSATVKWATTEESTTEVHYGETAALGGVLRKIIPMEDIESVEMIHSMWIPELKPGTKYYYRVVSRADGTAVQSDIMSFTTLAPAVRKCTSADWSCGEWGQCSTSGIRTRECRVASGCESDGAEKPALEEKCQPECLEDVWKCEPWGACTAAGMRFRRCDLVQDCATVETPKPALEEKCQPPVVAEEAPKPVAEPVDQLPKQLEEESAPLPKTEPRPEPAPLPADGPKPMLIDEAMPEKNPEDVGLGIGEPGDEPLLEQGNDEEVPPAKDAEPLPPRTDKPMMTPPPSDPDRMMSEMTSGIERVMEYKAAAQSSGGGAPLPPPTPQDICSLNGVAKENCLAWIKVKYGDRKCHDAGIMRRETCEDFLAAQNGGVFPGCRGKSPEECRLMKDMVLGGYMDQVEAEHADKMTHDAMEAGKPDAVISEGMTAVREDRTVGFGVKESVRGVGHETTPGVLIIDKDGNGVPDDLESRINEDEKVGESPTAKALVSGKPIEQPRGFGDETDDFVMELLPPSEAESRPMIGQLRGKCESGSVCLIYVYSYMPLVLTVTTDDQGNFAYDLSDDLADGTHEVYVAITDETGKITRKSKPFDLLVSGAQAVTVDELVTLDPITFAQVEAVEAKEQRWFVYGAAFLVVMAGMVVGMVFRRRSQPVGA